MKDRGSRTLTQTHLSVDPHPDLLTWWAWRNGSPIDNLNLFDHAIIGTYWSYGLDIATQHRERQVAYFEPNIWPGLHTFPVIGLENVRDLYLNTVTGSLGLYDPHSWTEDDNNPFMKQWDNLAAWLNDVIALYNTGNVHHSPTSGEYEINLSDLPSTVHRSSYWPIRNDLHRPTPNPT